MAVELGTIIVIFCGTHSVLVVYMLVCICPSVAILARVAPPQLESKHTFALPPAYQLQASAERRAWRADAAPAAAKLSTICSFCLA